METNGSLALRFPIRSRPVYPITYRLVNDTLENGWTLLLHDKDTNNAITPLKWSATCPVRLLHGTNDMDVPIGKSIELAQWIGSDIVAVIPIDGGDHRLSTPASLKVLLETLHLS